MEEIKNLIYEAYEYINEVRKYADLDESDEHMLDDALAAISEVERRLENEDN